MDAAPAALTTHDLSLYYGRFRAVRDVNLAVPQQRITAIIGPSGCGKSTLLRSFNRMNDVIPGTRAEGRIMFAGQNILVPEVDPVVLRRRIGMVFQKPNPFPKSIFDNVAYGPRINGYRGHLEEIVEQNRTSRDWWSWNRSCSSLSR